MWEVFKSPGGWEEGDEYSTVAILIFISHNLIAWNMFLTNIFVSFTQSFCFITVNFEIILRRKHNQVSDTLRSGRLL